jgi:hypothetical protein
MSSALFVLPSSVWDEASPARGSIAIRPDGACGCPSLVPSRCGEGRCGNAGVGRVPGRGEGARHKEYCAWALSCPARAFDPVPGRLFAGCGARWLSRPGGLLLDYAADRGGLRC